MSAEEMRSFAPALRQHLETTDQEMDETKQELGKYKAWATLGDVTEHVHKILLKIRSPRGHKFGSVVEFADALASEKEDGHPGFGHETLDHAILRMNEVHPSGIKLPRDLAKFVIDFYADRNRKFHGPIEALVAKKDWVVLAQWFQQQLNNLPEIALGWPSDTVQKFPELLTFCRDSIITKVGEGKWIEVDQTSFKPPPPFRPLYASLSETSRDLVFQAEATDVTTLTERHCEEERRQKEANTRDLRRVRSEEKLIPWGLPISRSDNLGPRND